MRFSAGVVFAACVLCASAANYTTYIGDGYAYQVSAIAVDASGNTYITGSRVITISQYGPVTDVFVSKLNPSGNLIPIGTFSGKGTDQANGIAVDSSGNIYIVGSTSSADFPLRNPLQSTPVSTYDGSVTGFLMKLAPDGSLVYSTFLGGTLAPSSLNAVAVDSNGNAYVIGSTLASDYQHTPGLPAGTVGPGIGAVTGEFFAKIDPTGSHVLYAGVLSANQRECGEGSSCFTSPLTSAGTGIAVDPSGNAYLVGNANGGGLPTTSGVLEAQGIGAFVGKVNAAGTGLAYLTYLGANNASEESLLPAPLDSVYAIEVDAEGNAYISGATADPNFPVTQSAFQRQLGGSFPNAFVAKLNPSGSAMVWATYLGGTQTDQANTIAVDPSGNVWVSGTTQSADFPHTFAWPNGGEFLSELDATGTKLLYSAVLPTNVAASGLAVDSSGIVHYAGGAGVISAVAPSAAPSQESSPLVFGIANAAAGPLAGRCAPGEVISIYGLHFGPSAPISGTFDAQGFLPTKLGGIQVMIDGIAAPLLYVSDTQINAVSPVELTVGSTELEVIQSETSLPSFRTEVVAADPQVFLNPDGSAAAINQDGTVNSKANPAKAGSYVSIWATGVGSFPGADGQKATAANDFCQDTCAIVINNGGTFSSGNWSYAGTAPGLVNGVVQINLQATGFGLYYLSVDGNYSSLFSVWVAP